MRALSSAVCKSHTHEDLKESTHPLLYNVCSLVSLLVNPSAVVLIEGRSARSSLRKKMDCFPVFSFNSSIVFWARFS